MAASQFSSSTWPQSAIALKGTLDVNGYPAGPKDSYMTVGGIVDSTDANNNGISVAKFGYVVSCLKDSPDKWVVGVPSGYIPRGILIVDNGIMYNEPMKADGYAVDLSATAMIRGYARYSKWTNTGTGALATPYLGCVPIVHIASGFIEFAPSGTTVAPSGFMIPKNVDGVNMFKFTDLDPLLGSTSVGGALLYVQAF